MSRTLKFTADSKEQNSKKISSELISKQRHLDRRILEVCEAAGVFIEHWGFKKIHGRVWTLLALRRDPTTQAELARLLNVSRSSISGAISDLDELGLVLASSQHRHATYDVVLDVWPIIADVLRSREWMYLERARLAMEAVLDAMKDLSSEENHYHHKRLHFLLGMAQMGQMILLFLISLRLSPNAADLTIWLQRAQDAVTILRKRMETFAHIFKN